MDGRLKLQICDCDFIAHIIKILFVNVADVHQREAAVCRLHIQWSDSLSQGPSEANLQNQGRLQIRSEPPLRLQVQVQCDLLL